MNVFKSVIVEHAQKQDYCSLKQMKTYIYRNTIYLIDIQLLYIAVLRALYNIMEDNA